MEWDAGYAAEVNVCELMKDIPSVPVFSRVFTRNTLLNSVKGFLIPSGDTHDSSHLDLLIRCMTLMGFLLLNHTCIPGIFHLVRVLLS